MPGEQDGSFRLGYDLAELESDGKRAAILAEEHGARIASAHAKHAKESGEKWKAFSEHLGTDELKGGFLGLLGGGTLVGGLAGTLEYFHHLTEEYGHLADIAQRFDTTPESIQRLQMHAKLAGTDVETVASAMGRLLQSLERGDDPKINKAFQDLNLSAVELAGIGPERQLEVISRAFNHVQEEGRGGEAALRDLLGRGYTPLIAAIREYDEVSQKLKNHPVVSDADVARLKESGDEFERIGNAMKVDVAKGFLNVLSEMRRATEESKGKGMVDWMQSFFKEPPGWREAMAKERIDNARIAAQNKHGAPMADADSALGMFLGPHEDRRSGLMGQLQGQLGPYKAHLGEIAKEWNEKSGMMQRVSEARSAREAKLNEENHKEMLAAQEGLNAARSAAGEAALSDLEKQVYLEGVLADKEREIAEFKDSDEFTEVGVVKLETERVKLMGQLADQTQKAADAAAEAAAKERQHDMELAKRLQHEHELVETKLKGQEGMLLELQIMQLQSQHRHRDAAMLQDKMKLEETVGKFKAAGFKEEDAKAFALQKLSMEAKAAGHKFSFRPDGSLNHGPAPMSEAGRHFGSLDELLQRKNGAVANHDDFFKRHNPGNDPIEQWRLRLSSEAFKKQELHKPADHRDIFTRMQESLTLIEQHLNNL